MRLWLIGFILSGIVLNGMGCAVAQEESQMVGKRAADFTLERVKGTSASLYELIKGKKAILFFYASWCPHCREQIKAIEDRKTEIRNDGIEVVLVDVGESKSQVMRFLKENKIEQDSFLDADSFVAQTYQVMGIPTLVFIGADGVVRYVEYGLPEDYKKILN
ncbi:MAG: TlpA disulfide reductase family protein [Candidatus Omnitrophota bacterium]